MSEVCGVQLLNILSLNPADLFNRLLVFASFPLFSPHKHGEEQQTMTEALWAVLFFWI